MSKSQRYDPRKRDVPFSNRDKTNPAFTIPKKKNPNDILQPIEVGSREYINEIELYLKNSFHYEKSQDNFKVKACYFLKNGDLQDQYNTKRQNMIKEGRGNKEIHDAFYFLEVKSLEEAKKVATEGVKINNVSKSWLGQPKMGVCLQRHADIVTERAPDSGILRIMILKVIKGRAKFVHQQMEDKDNLEPTPEHDCHVLNNKERQTNHTRIYRNSQVYYYEYVDYDIVERPSLILPYAYVEAKIETSLPNNRMNGTTIRKPMSSTNSTPRNQPAPSNNNPPQRSPARGKCEEVWKGELMVDNKDLNHVKLLSLTTAYRPTNLPSFLNANRFCTFEEAKSLFFFDKPLRVHCLRETTLSDHNGQRFFILYYILEAHNNERFNYLVDTLQKENRVALGMVDNTTDFILIPPSSFATKLGLENKSNVPMMHCLFIQCNTFGDRFYIKPKTVQNAKMFADYYLVKKPDLIAFAHYFVTERSMKLSNLKESRQSSINSTPPFSPDINPKDPRHIVLDSTNFKDPRNNHTPPYATSPFPQDPRDPRNNSTPPFATSPFTQDPRDPRNNSTPPFATSPFPQDPRDPRNNSTPPFASSFPQDPRDPRNNSTPPFSPSSFPQDPRDSRNNPTPPFATSSFPQDSRDPRNNPTPPFATSSFPQDPRDSRNNPTPPFATSSFPQDPRDSRNNPTPPFATSFPQDPRDSRNNPTPPFATSFPQDPRDPRNNPAPPFVTPFPQDPRDPRNNHTPPFVTPLAQDASKDPRIRRLNNLTPPISSSSSLGLPLPSEALWPERSRKHSSNFNDSDEGNPPKIPRLSNPDIFGPDKYKQSEIPLISSTTVTEATSNWAADYESLEEQMFPEPDTTSFDIPKSSLDENLPSSSKDPSDSYFLSQEAIKKENTDSQEIMEVDRNNERINDNNILMDMFKKISNINGRIEPEKNNIVDSLVMNATSFNAPTETFEKPKTPSSLAPEAKSTFTDCNVQISTLMVNDLFQEISRHNNSQNNKGVPFRPFLTDFDKVLGEESYKMIDFFDEGIVTTSALDASVNTNPQDNLSLGSVFKNFDAGIRSSGSNNIPDLELFSSLVKHS